MNYEKLLRKIRSHPALWGERGEAKCAQAARILRKAKKRLEPVWEERRREVEHRMGQRLLSRYH